MLEEHTGLFSEEVWHVAPAGRDTPARDFKKNPAYERPCDKLVPVLQFPIDPRSVSSVVSGSSPRLKLRYGRKIYSLDEISLVILFITELHPHM